VTCKRYTLLAFKRGIVTIQPGTRLGPYEVLSAIGAGRMGEVYKARDTRLNRTVAIKVLPNHLADKSELRSVLNAKLRLSPDSIIRTFVRSMTLDIRMGHWLVYVSDEFGRNEIYIQPYFGPGGKSQISTDGGNEPVWNPNERELFYRSGANLMAVDISTRPALSIGKPRKLFAEIYDRTNVAHPYYDVSPDGNRFLMIRPSGQGLSTLTQIVLVQNFFEELKRRAPAGTQ
jgi:serine/threonine protein kinase